MCVVRQSSLRRADHPSRVVLPGVVFLSVIVKPRQNGKDGTLLHTGNTQIKIAFVNKLRAEYLCETTATILSRNFCLPIPCTKVEGLKYTKYNKYINQLLH